MEQILSLLAILFLVFTNGFFVASEFALVSIRPSRLEELTQNGDIFHHLTKKAVMHIDAMLSVCQVGITIASLCLGWIGEKFFERIIYGTLVLFPIQLDERAIVGTSIVISFSLITLLHVILGELVPKSIAIQKTETVAIRISLAMWFFYYLFFPITFLMNKISGGVLLMFRLRITGDKYVHSAQELMILIEEHEKNDEKGQGLQLLQKTFHFSDKTAKDVMTHRLSIIGIPQEATIDKLLPIIAEHNFSRYPVYEQTLDFITGVIHVQSFLKWFAENGLAKAKKTKVTALMQKELTRLPDTMKIDKAMAKLREKKQHMGIVVDQWGGVSGIATLEDIIEELFGEIRDETDPDENPVIASNRKNKSVQLEGERELNQIPQIILEEDIQGIEEDVRTLAGLIMYKAEGMPEEGAVIPIKKGVLKVKKMEGNKIGSVLFLPKVEETENESSKAY